jgi:branched-chain amino acid transport system permease protein
VSILLQEAVRNFYPDAKSAKVFPQLLDPSWQLHLPAGVDINLPSLVTVVVAVVGMVSLSAFVRRSRTGRAMQATAQDPDTARLMGIDTDRIIVTAFVLGAALAAVAGLAQGLRFGQVDFRMGFLTGVKAFTAAVLGGIGNISGAVLGGFTLGLVEVMATQYAPEPFAGGAWKDAWAFVVLIIVLVFRPTGLLGERVAARA